jgi:hypothetical protein
MLSFQVVPIPNFLLHLTNRIFAFSGYCNDLYELELSTGTNSRWINLANVTRGVTPTPRAGLGISTLDGVIYVCGGYKNTGHQPRGPPLQ